MNKLILAVAIVLTTVVTTFGLLVFAMTEPLL